MPGPVVHHIVAQKAFARLRGSHKLDIRDPAVRAGLLLGAQGPDFLFFNVKDWPVVGGTPVADAVGQWFGFLDILGEIKEGLLAPLKEVDEQLAQNSATYAQLRAVVVALKGTADTLGATVNAALESIVAKQFAYDVFDNRVGHPSQQASSLCDYKQPGNWWAFDMLHYRRSGRFTQTLFKNAQTPAQRAYALGYMTHYAADVVAHPFINLIAGGPYRTHSQRHKVIETNHDVLAFNKYFKQPELGASKLFEQYIFSAQATPDAIGSIDFKRRRLPGDVQGLLLDSIKAVYRNTALGPQYGRQLTPDDLDTAFSLWLRWFEHATSFLEDITPPQAITLSDELAAIWADAQAKVAAAWAGVGSPGPGQGGVLGFFESIAAAIMAALEVVGALIESALALIDAAAASGLAVASTVIRDLLLLIQQYAYSDLFLGYHRVLVLQGLAYPTKEQADFPQTLHMRNPSWPDAQGRSAPQYAGVFFPLKSYRPAGQESEAHLVYPFSTLAGSPYDIKGRGVREYPASHIGPQDYLGLMSVDLIEGCGKTSDAVYERCMGMGTSGYLDDAVKVTAGGSLGGAVPFSEFVYDRLSRGLTLNDFDLDADRGYGYPSWQIEDPAHATSKEVPLVVEPQPPHNDGAISPRHVKRV